MTTLLPHSFLTKLVYPATLAALGLVGNVLILGKQIQEVKDDLGNQVKGLSHDLNEVTQGIRSLGKRQTEMELHKFSIAETLLKDCNKKR